MQGTGGIKINPVKFLLLGGSGTRLDLGVRLLQEHRKKVSQWMLTRLVRKCRQLSEPDETRKGAEAGVVTGEEEGLRKNTGWGECV